MTSLFDHLCGRGQYETIFCGQGELFRVPALSQRTDEYLGYVGTAGSEQSGGGKSTGFCLPAKGTSWILLLGPWMVFWIAAGIDSHMGSFLSIGAAALFPLLFYAHKKTIYDTMGGAMVVLLSVAMLFGISERIAMPLSYLCYGLMWTTSCLGKRIPLTACYSMNDYGGEDALFNPLFMKTNRILTMVWGVLYLLTPIWTYLIMSTEIGYLTGAVNSVLPIAMGIFTAWFQKWYPAKVARGD